MRGALVGILFLFVFVFLAVFAHSKDTVTIEGESMEFRNKGMLTVYRNGVLIRKGGNWLKALEAVANEDTGELLIEGDITARYTTEKGDVVKIGASAARYNRDYSRGVLYGDPFIIVENKERPDGNIKMRAEKIEMREDEGLIKAEGNVYMSNPTIDIWSEKASYNQETGIMTLEGGNPFIVSIEDGVVNYHRSDEITILTDEGKIIFNNKVRSIVWGRKDASGKKSK